MTVDFTVASFGGDVFLSKPKNVALISGQRMEMECGTDNESKVTAWYFAPSTSNASPVTLVSNIGANIQFSENVSPEFGVNFDANGSGIIYLNSTTMNDSGIYTCEVEKYQNIMKFSAQLIVFGKNLLLIFIVCRISDSVTSTAVLSEIGLFYEFLKL